jgi:hypothetical protein
MGKSFTVSGLSTGVTYSATRPSGDTWLTVSQSGNTVTASAGAYASTTADRSSTITVTASDGATAQVSVTQYRKSSLALTPASLTFDAAGN